VPGIGSKTMLRGVIKTAYMDPPDVASEFIFLTQFDQMRTYIRLCMTNVPITMTGANLEIDPVGSGW
jgi:hypothetical protein